MAPIGASCKHSNSAFIKPSESAFSAFGRFKVSLTCLTKNLVSTFFKLLVCLNGYLHIPLGPIWCVMLQWFWCCQEHP